ncbi:DNA topology modulation protein FlaR [Anaerobacillus alkalidiazotrophicus]|uniref:DNA topology modulation protein FlaR n=1 Tax=Anaerobacillus alkalidiazotrophicus TaxID=472963 RepID=A0A1S2M3A5_9BACI|nr:AAA family ATPase [Anaerobacillus alkalidiazotrophicus]OIJ19010.1 DNA topology modulation protein FlaR [Anaerobacillus alkalidiazotrophicus]
MKKNIPNKIHIIGSVGSGKTTLARELSSKLNVPFYELDNVVWKRHKELEDIRRTEKEREEFLNTLISSNTWIIEGIHNEEWVTNSFRNAELIIFLDTNYSVRTYRIIRRFLLQKLGLEKSNYKPTLKIFFKMFKWNRHFEEVGKPKFYNEFGKYDDKILVVTNKKEIENYFTG